MLGVSILYLYSKEKIMNNSKLWFCGIKSKIINDKGV